jgi:two-component system phosphate regulon sensor histidine kinase PhoR
MAGEGMVNDEERVRSLVERVDDLVVVLDSERRLVAASPPAATVLGDPAPGRRLGENVGGALVLFVGELPELTAYEELRAGFTAAVSHELRTPLARLLSLLETATLPGAEVEALLEQAQQEVHQARELIDDVLFLGQLESGREVVALGRTPAVPILRKVVAALADRAEHAEITLEVVGGDEIELPLRPRMLRVVGENLVANSIRYAGPGSTCRVTVARTGDAATLTVADDGVGLGPEDRIRIFERFYRADTARTSRGTGLGLAIVKHIVTSAGGTIEATGAVAEGLAIRCTFPA